MHRGYGFGHKNEARESILELVLAYDLCISNTFFMKSEEHLITFKSGAIERQINFFSIKKSEHLFCKNCKVDPVEPILTQQGYVH